MTRQRCASTALRPDRRVTPLARLTAAIALAGCGPQATELPADTAAVAAVTDVARVPDTADPDAVLSVDAQEIVASHDAADAVIGPDGAVDASADATPADGPCQLAASHDTLIPPPLSVSLTLKCAGVALQEPCAWTAGPASVCKLVAPGQVRKQGDGTCSVTCTRSNGTGLTRALVAKTQTVIYVVGGNHDGPPWTSEITRLRAADKQWDTAVATVEEIRIRPSAGVWNGKLFVVGGAVDGSDAQKQSNPSGFPKCPEAIESLGGTEGGCRAIRALDLNTGEWSVPAEMDTVEWEMGARQIGPLLYLLTTDPQWLMRLDMEKEKFELKKILPPAGTKGFSAIAPWGKDGLLVFTGSTTWAWTPNETSGTLIDIGYPCKHPGPNALFSFPGAAPNVFIKGSDFPVYGSCPPLKPTTSEYLALFRRRLDGKWSEFKPLATSTPYLVPVESKDAVYILQDAFTANPVPPVYRLSSINGDWEELPPMPYWRSNFAAVAVEQ